MVAIVNSGENIQEVLNYNEQKVSAGVAQCIQANLFKSDKEKLNFYDKLHRFTDLNAKNLRTKTNTLHISLNFDVTEKLKVDELNSVATLYMNKIGFNDQPYLVYEHKDAAHQHVHIVTTLIREDGKRIPIHFLGKNESEKARKEIEKEFNLVIAEKQNKGLTAILPVNIEKAVYGKSQTRESIADIVTAVTRTYKYTSLPELNAALRQFNVTADRGTEKSKMFEKKGLLYGIVDAKGKRIGIPFKASALPGKPTLRFLEKQFLLNEVLRTPHKAHLKTVIEKALKDSETNSKELFTWRLGRQNIKVTFRSNAEGRTFGVTFIDNQNRTVFNGSDLGKTYSATAILDRLSQNANVVQPYRPGYTSVRLAIFNEEPTIPSAHLESGSLLNDLLHSEESDAPSPDAVLRLGRKRRRKRGHRF